MSGRGRTTSLQRHGGQAARWHAYARMHARIHVRIHARMLRPSDAGQVTAFVVIMITGLFVFAGLVLDGGLALRDKVQAIDEAQEAARAGAQSLDLAQYRASGDVVLVPAQAAAAAHTYLRATGNPLADTAQVTVTGDRVSVTVTRSQPTQILGIAGLGTITVHGAGTAVAEHGIDAPQQ